LSSSTTAGTIQSFNAAAERMLGCSEQDVLGTDLERFVPERFVVRTRRSIPARSTAPQFERAYPSRLRRLRALHARASRH
jgi:PAS domain S-box-containing protein